MDLRQTDDVAWATQQVPFTCTPTHPPDVSYVFFLVCNQFACFWVAASHGTQDDGPAKVMQQPQYKDT